MTKFEIKPDFVVFQTGYTNEIINKLNSLIKIIIDSEIYICVKDLDESEFVIKNQIMFISEGYEPTYISKYIDISKQIYENLDKDDRFDTICFKTYSRMYIAMNLIQCLQDHQYCACLNHCNIFHMVVYEINGFTILHITIDCESG
ncbi:MAG: hypothetical protein Satyrvirus11_23 [Satyrvirus sp.]|uniref:Uncharacterized protein n=1 Tax=Satyrvirus sp. TaxID=2487771 RepID=A0A3G5AGB9_9VIRU|nr:MAG: hypothetical protein Satyrvirus11_23 [Satyrvirus sp.]